MEAKRFLKEANRMCKNRKCDECPAVSLDCLTDISLETPNEDIDKLVEIVEEWSKNNPIVTNLDKMVEIFGDETVDFLEAYLRYTCTDDVFRKEASAWLGEEYKDVDKK